MATLPFTLQYHDELNPKIWDGDHLRPEVREKLKHIALTWAESANIPLEDIHDIVMTGGNANFNYSDHSDIDVHLVVDKEKMGPKDLIDDYLHDKKVVWEFKHPDIRVRGYGVELYAQGVDEPFPTQQGVYSVEDDTWHVRPSHDPIDYGSDTGLKRKVDYYSRRIGELVNEPGNVKALKNLKLRLQIKRGAGLRAAGERAIPNLLYKELRNRGVLGAVNLYIQKNKDAELSLESVSL